MPINFSRLKYDFQAELAEKNAVPRNVSMLSAERKDAQTYRPKWRNVTEFQIQCQHSENVTELVTSAMPAKWRCQSYQCNVNNMEMLQSYQRACHLLQFIIQM